MVYCTKCGALNPDTANNCSNCGASLTDKTYKYVPHRSYERNYPRRQGGGFGLLIAGLFIVIIGVAALLGFTVFWAYFWPLVLILIGIWIILLGVRRNRRYRQL
ncbi:MAG: zinc-ribbon domain-containing protein [Candidatus Bathyarchaeota archaeon]|nr:zinc-ribbon domain-containing protein [Candidatus Bathyarchaeota archaeon]